MHRIDSSGNVAGAWSNGTPPLTPGTAMDAAWFNAVQEEVINIIETHAGITLVKGTNTQLWSALIALFGRLGAANTWTGTQNFNGTGGVNVNADSGLYVQKNVLIDGNLSVGDAVNPSVLQDVSAAAVSAVSLLLSSFLRVTGAARLAGGVENATAATAATPQNALELLNGNLKLSGAMPNSNVGFSNTLGPNSFAKAHCVVEIASGTPTLQGKGKNIGSVSTVSNGGLSTGVLRVTFATPMASVWYTAVPAVMSASLPMKGAAVVTLNANYCDIAVFTTGTGGTVVDLLSGSAVVSLIVMGEQ